MQRIQVTRFFFYQKRFALGPRPSRPLRAGGPQSRETMHVRFRRRSDLGNSANKL